MAITKWLRRTCDDHNEARRVPTAHVRPPLGDVRIARLNHAVVYASGMCARRIQNFYTAFSPTLRIRASLRI